MLLWHSPWSFDSVARRSHTDPVNGDTQHSRQQDQDQEHDDRRGREDNDGAEIEGATPVKDAENETKRQVNEKVTPRPLSRPQAPSPQPSFTAATAAASMRLLCVDLLRFLC